MRQLRAGVQLTDVQQQLGRARIGITKIYANLTNRGWRSYADRVAG